MSFHLTVAGSLEPLADSLAQLLAESPLADPFAPELLVTPAQGVRAWLGARLAHRLGAGPADTAGVVANLTEIFPATLVNRALGPAAEFGRWNTGPLTWAVYEVLLAKGRDGTGDYEEPADAVRAWAIADLFDRYTLYRQDMAVRWSEGKSVDAVGAALGEHQRWQQRLWMEVQAHLGGKSDAQIMRELIEQLRGGATLADLGADVPERVIIFGLASLPPPHLNVIAALSRSTEVHVYAPTASAQRWESLRAQSERPLALPILRVSDEAAALVGFGNPLVTSWGRTSREANVLLVNSAASVGATVIAPEVPVTPVSDTLLSRLQFDVRADRALPAPDDRLVIDPSTDQSLRWHRAYGPARQVEVLRDALLHLFEQTNADGSPTYQPRDVAVLCTDVERFAPLIEATFAGDPAHNLPSLPVRVADRTLQQENSLLDAASSLLSLLEGRFRATDVLAFVSRAPVRRGFGLSADAISRISEWVRATNIRWGLDPEDQSGERYGLPVGLGVHTWRDGLDQLLLGATMTDAGPRLGIADVAPFGDVEGSDVEIAGSLAEFINVLDTVTTQLRETTSVEQWCNALSAALSALCEVEDADGWMWRAVEKVIDTFRIEALVNDIPRQTLVESTQLASLLEARLVTGGGGRPRFETGAITVSGITALRGVPFPIVCVVGLDRDLGAGGLGSAEDLVLAQPCIGDRDSRGQQRAQFLDAVLSAGHQLLLFSTGNDVRTNTPLPPIVAVADLIDIVNATARTNDVNEKGEPVAAMSVLTTDHPRQSWSEKAFIPGALGVPGPWSFDEGARLAALQRRERTEDASWLTDPLPAPTNGEPGDPNNTVINLDDVLAALVNPAKTFLSDRLGVSVPSEQDEPDDHIPLELGNLESWSLANELLTQKLSTADVSPEWETVARRSGKVPPLSFGDAALNDAVNVVSGLLIKLATGVRSETLAFNSVAVDTSFTLDDGRTVRLVGSLPRVIDSVIVNISPSAIKDADRLVAWVQLAALALQEPNQIWRAIIVGKKNGRPAYDEYVLEDSADPSEILSIAIDLYERAMRDAVPAIPATTRTLFEKGLGAAASSWGGERGDRNDRWMAMLFGTDFDGLRSLPRRADEAGVGWPVNPRSRLHLWAERIWGNFNDTMSDEVAKKKRSA